MIVIGLDHQGNIPDTFSALVGKGYQLLKAVPSVAQ